MFLRDGTLGLLREDAEIDYIYSLNYDMRLLRSKVRKAGRRAMFGINTAFWPGLEIRDAER
jgi:hypothetical protein